jgi:hypothetical protein
MARVTTALGLILLAALPAQAQIVKGVLAIKGAEMS